MLPRSREARLLRRLRENAEDAVVRAKDWSVVFAVAARRHHHQTTVAFFSAREISLPPAEHCFERKKRWDVILRFDGLTRPLYSDDVVWAYGSGEGLLVYRLPSQEYCALDVALGSSQIVPFTTKGRIVRRVRLEHGVLVFEWAEREAFHPLNEGEGVHRHFASVFDVWTHKGEYDTLPDLGASKPGDAAEGERSKPQRWHFALRAEWETHSLGFPFATSDRFYCAHNATNYALYLWQPDRSPWGEDSPLERLTVWDIGNPRKTESCISVAPVEPDVIRNITNEHLALWGLRQSDTPSLRSVALDSEPRDPHTGQSTGHLFFLTEEHLWAAASQSGLPPRRLHSVCATGIPLQGNGPVWVNECSGNAVSPACRGNAFAVQEEDAWPGWAPCWLHEDFPSLTVAQLVDRLAGSRFDARQCLSMEYVSVNRDPEQGTASSVSREDAREGANSADVDGALQRQVRFLDGTWRRIMEKGKIAGDERWMIGETPGAVVTVLYF
ncbi:hypothetical protein VD0004_g3146 [Verticillium dahliae]|uniref:F-box domain-containing protein n=1 Tax=Verticillium dahliae TaxID=27337 RepID=A0A444S302_VERDA|nr:hypothetical protein VD0004_g3146 [Verticillium dahliae]PNH75426.1 hypothetical protein VD0001_g2125 [Verticillium dahliae]RXG47768.1 hypothetical protein VDGE_04158 [Verticillium dahliae]